MRPRLGYVALYRIEYGVDQQHAIRLRDSRSDRIGDVLKEVRLGHPLLARSLAKSCRLPWLTLRAFPSEAGQGRCPPEIVAVAADRGPYADVDRPVGRRPERKSGRVIVRRVWRPVPGLGTEHSAGDREQAVRDGAQPERLTQTRTRRSCRHRPRCH